MSLLNSATLANEETAYYIRAGSGVPIPGPPGPAGAPGAPGPQGEPGLSILSGAGIPVSGTGDVGDLYVDLNNGEVFKKIDPTTWQSEFYMIGPQGIAATVSVGLTTTVAPGTPAAVNNTGTAQNAVLNFAIPQGIQGPMGPPGSAADAAQWATYPAESAIDCSGFPINGATSINATGVLDISAGGNIEVVSTGDIELASTGTSDPAVRLVDCDFDLNGNDIKDLGSLRTSGVGNSVVLGSYVPPAAPLANFQVIASDIAMTHIDPLTPLNITSAYDARIEATGGDLNLIGKDVNIGATGTLDVLNISAVGAIQQTAGGAINNTAGGAYAVQAGGLISILTTGNISIGSGNVLGASTSIEKLDIDDSVVSKLNGAADLEFENVKSITNDTNALLIEATQEPLTLRGEGLTIATTGNVAAEDIHIATTLGDSLRIAASTGIATFTSVPQCTSNPIGADDLTRKGYVDSAVATCLPANTTATLTNNLVAAAASGASASPFIYVPGTAGPPTGTPTVIAGAVPLYVDTTGFGKLYGYFNGAWLQL